MGGALMHGSVMDYLREQLTPDRVRGALVLEVGALDVEGDTEGTARDLCGLARGYVGIDLSPGRNVDVVCDAADAPNHFRDFDVAVSTEMLEHAQDWRAALIGMAGVLRLGGLLILTCRGPGAGRHDHPGDHWRFTPNLLRNALTDLGLRVSDIREDREIPGVLVTARRSSPHSWSMVLAQLHAEPAPPR